MSKEIKSFEDIKQFSIIILLYQTGSSGEFIATALSQTLNNFAKGIFNKKSEDRWDFQDAFWKSLNGGWSNIDPDDVISRFRLYLNDKSNVTETTHIALAHPLGASLKFIKQYLYECPVIEIITKNKLSFDFMNAAKNKVSLEDFTSAADRLSASDIEKEMFKSTFYNLQVKKESGYMADKHLKIEWQDLMFDTAKSYRSIEQFLNCQGSVEKFQLLVNDYLLKNKSIIDQCYS
jgi:hypothetical protein